MDKFKKILGENIKNRRKELGITQDDLAETIHKLSNFEQNIDRSQISRWEKGVNKPDPVYQKLLCEALKVPESFFDTMDVVTTAVYRYSPPGKTETSSAYKFNQLDQAFMLTEAQLKALSENVAKHGVKAAMDAINKPTVSKQDTKNLSEKDKLILEITASLPLLNINNLKGINNSINRLVSPSRKIKKPVNS